MRIFEISLISASFCHCQKLNELVEVDPDLSV